MTATVRHINTGTWLLAHTGEDVDTMAGPTFEECLAVMFERRGYQAELTEYFDKGADLIVVDNRGRTAVQAKRWNSRVTIEAVEQAARGREAYGCNTAAVFTNSDVKANVWTLAQRENVTIHDRHALEVMLWHAKMVLQPELKPPPICVRCSVSLVHRESRKGPTARPFWGCPNYGRLRCGSKAPQVYTLVLI